MPTNNRRVAAYLPRHIDERLESFKTERGLKGDSSALIAILSEYFGVAHQLAQEVGYSSFVKTDQFNELTARVDGLVEVIERSSSLSSLFNELFNEFEQLKARVASLELSSNEDASLSTEDLARRLGISSSTLSRWKGAGKRSKSANELLRATREKDPDGVGWVLIPGTGRFKPEQVEEDKPLQHELLGSSLGKF